MDNNARRTVLSTAQINNLPKWYEDDLRAALADPSKDFLGAALAVGRILRSGDCGGDVVSKCRSWASNLSERDIAVIGNSAEQELINSSQILTAVTDTNENAGAMMRHHFKDDLGTDEESDELIVSAENDFSDIAKTSHFAPLLIEQRDDAESLLFVLGIKALSGDEQAAFWESRIRARAASIDRVCRVIEDVIADALAAAPKPRESTWLPRIAALANGQWWLDLMLVRSDRLVKEALSDREEATNIVTETLRNLIKLPQGLFQSRDLLGRLAAAFSSQGLAYVSTMGEGDLKAEILDSEGKVIAQVVTDNGETVIRSVEGPLSDEITIAVKTVINTES